MNPRAAPPFATLLAAAALLAGTACAPPIQRRTPEPPPRPAPPPVRSTAAPPRPAAPAVPAATVGKQRALDLQYQGDLAAALIQWRILRTLAPDDPEIQRQLAATRALVRHRLEADLATGAAAEQTGDTPGARGAYLRALALDPGDRVALTRLRSLETAALYAAQQARLDRLRARRARAVARKKEGRTAPARESRAENENGQERDYRDMGIALFKAGDYAASILELRKYLGSFPEDDAAREVLLKAEERARQITARTSTGVPRPVPTTTVDNENTPLPETAASPGAPAAPPPPPPKISLADKEAAQDLYEQGVRVSRQNIAEAIRFWEQSLQRNPHHVQAGLRLEQAHKIQRRLDAIDQRRD